MAAGTISFGVLLEDARKRSARFAALALPAALDLHCCDGADAGEITLDEIERIAI
jgi:hypothetical protein